MSIYPNNPRCLAEVGRASRVMVDASGRYVLFLLGYGVPTRDTFSRDAQLGGVGVGLHLLDIGLCLLLGPRGLPRLDLSNLVWRNVFDYIAFERCLKAYDSIGEHMCQHTHPLFGGGRENAASGFRLGVSDVGQDPTANAT